MLNNRAVHGIMWENTVELDRPQMATWRMRIACWIPKATNTNSQHVIPIVSPQHQRLHERAAMLLCTYIDCAVCIYCRSAYSAAYV
jgi:hypothetical protein